MISDLFLATPHCKGRAHPPAVTPDVDYRCCLNELCAEDWMPVNTATRSTLLSSPHTCCTPNCLVFFPVFCLHSGGKIRSNSSSCCCHGGRFVGNIGGGRIRTPVSSGDAAAVGRGGCTCRSLLPAGAGVRQHGQQAQGGRVAQDGSRDRRALRRSPAVLDEVGGGK